MTTPRTGGELLLGCLEAQGVDRVFCVPGESYLPVLDALHDSHVETVVARHEGGAAMMAEADGKLTGRPGVALVTRGPGATNAASGVHVARQDSTPMVLLVGQIGRDMGGREAFQEVDYRQTFGSLAKWVDQIDRVERIPEVISHAWHVALGGRPGPVVVALPEDMLRERTNVGVGEWVGATESAPTQAQIDELEDRLGSAKSPLVIVGGSRWNQQATADLSRWARRWQLPIAASFRRQSLVDHADAHYVGDVGLGINPALAQRIANSDLLILLGCRFSENPSQGFKLLGIPETTNTLVHVHPGPEELGRIYRPDLAICASPGAFLGAALVRDPTTRAAIRAEQASIEKASAEQAHPPATAARVEAARADYLAWSANPARTPGRLQMGEVMQCLNGCLPDDALITNGAGNYAGWLHRYYRFGGWGTQLAPISGSMGYGLPAAIAAKLRAPNRSVVCIAGDGCFQMTGQELGTAVQARANVIVLVIDNSMYGTIRMHQEGNYPGRVSATTLVNPDFVGLANAYGAYAEQVLDADELPAALDRAQSSGLPALLHLPLDPEAISVGATLSEIRDSALKRKV